MFELNGKQYSIEQLEAAADAQNITFEEFMEAMRAKGMVEVQQQEVIEQPIEQTLEDPFLRSAKKIYGPVEEVAVAEPMTTIEQPDMELPSEDTFLELPKANVENLIKPLDDAFFSVDEEEGQKNFENLYKNSNLSFEQTTGAPTDDPGPILTGNIFNAIKIKYTNPKTGKTVESGPLQFGTTGKEYIKKNKEIISDFFKANLPVQEYNQIIAEQDKLIKQSFDAIDSYIPQEQKDNIEDKFNSLDLFKEKTETTVLPSTMYGGVSSTVTTKVKPYEAEINTQIEILKNNYPNASPDKLLRAAQNIVRAQQKEIAFASAREKAIEQIILDAKDVDIPFFEGFGAASGILKKIVGKEKQLDVQSEIYTANLLATAKTEDIANRYKLAINTLGLMNNVVGKPGGATQEDYDTIVDNAKALNIQFKETDQEITLSNGIVINAGFAQMFKEVHDVANADNEIYKGYVIDGAEAAEKYQKLSQITSAAGKNYDLAEKYMSNIALGFGDIGFNTLYLGGKLLSLGEYASPFGYSAPKPFNDALDTLAVNYATTVNDIRSSYVSDVNFEDAFSSANNFGRFAMQEITNQIPILVTMIASGGAAAYVVGASSAGGKMIDMRTEIVTGGADYNEAEIWLKSIGYGVFEGGFAAVTTVPILNKAKATWIKNGKGSVIDNSAKQFIKDKYSGLIYDPLLEAAGEVGTVGGQNLIDGKPFTQGMDHAGFSGAGFGLLFSGVPFLKGLHTSTFSDYNADRKIRDLKTEIGKLAATRENLTSELAIAEIDGQLKTLSIELADEINTQEDALKNLVTHKFGERITGIIEEQSNLKIQAKQTLDDASLDDRTKQSIINRLQNRYDQLQNIKDTALSDTFKRKFEGEFKALEGTDKAAYDGYLAEAKETLFQEKNNVDSTQEEVFRKAHDLYLLDKVQEANSKLKNFKGFKIFKTQDDAIAAIEKNNSIPDADKEGLIENIKNGDDGAAYRKGAERLMYVVEENQVLNQRKYIATHEVGHDVFWDILGTDPAAFDGIARQLLEGTKNVDEKLYNELSKETQSIEVVSRFLELVAGGDVDFRKNEKKKGLAGLFGTMVQKTFEGEYDFDFKGETDMFNFVVGIGKKIADGSLTTADIKAAKQSTIAQEAKGRVIPLPTPETRTKLTRAASAAKGKDLMQSLNRFSQNEDGSPKFTSKDEWRKSSEAGEAYFTVQQTSLLDGEIRKQKKLLGIPESQKLNVQEIKDNLALIVYERFDPSKNNLFGYMFAKLPNVNNLIGAEVANAKKKFVTTVDPGAKSIDVKAGEVGAVAELKADITTAEETIDRKVIEAAEEAATFNLTTSKAIEAETLKKAKAKVLSIVRVLKNKLGQAVSKNVNTVPIIKEIIQSSAKSIDIDLKKQMGGKEDLKLRNFVIDNKADIIKNTSATYLMGKNKPGSPIVNGGMPIVIEKSVGGRYTGKKIQIDVGGKTIEVEEFIPNFVPYPEWVGQKIDREKTVERGQTSGNQIVRKVDPDEISDKDFADFITSEDGTPIRGRKEALANELAGRLGGQIFKEAMTDPDSVISEAFEQNQDLRGAVLSDNFRNEIIEQTERGLIARSEKKKSEQIAINISDANSKLQNLTKKAFNRQNYKNLGEILGELESLKIDLENTNLPENFNNIIDAIAGSIETIVETESGKRGEAAETEVLLALNELQSDIKGLYVDPQTVAAGKRGGMPDIIYYLNGKLNTLEIKLNQYAALSTLPALEINSDGTIGDIDLGDTKLNETVNKKLKAHKPLQNYLSMLLGKNNEGLQRGEHITNKKGRGTILVNKYKDNNKKGFHYESLRKAGGRAEFNIEVPIKALNNVLGKKDFQTNEIQFMDVGLVQLTEFTNLNTKNKLDPEKDTVNIRFVIRKSTRKDGSYSINIIPTFFLSNDSRIKVSKNADTNLLNAKDGKKAFENVYSNTATQAASKGKANVDKLNEQYDKQQKSLTARSKGKLSPEFNKLLERNSGIGARKKLSTVVARKMGRNKGMFKLFLPPSAEDFRGLYYTMLGKGKQGTVDKKFFQENLVNPYTRGIASMEAAKQALLNDYKALRKVFRQSFKQEGIKMNQEIPGAKLSVEQAMRIYLWSDANIEIPGLTAADQKKALEYVYKNPVVQAYADSLLAISKQDQWSQPNEYWDAQSILSDLTDIALNVNRKKYLEQFIANKNEIFSESNLNKIEAIYGEEFRQAIEDIMYRMETGVNKPGGRDTITNKWNNWVNNSVGAIMFFNRRSATLQLLSTANFMNTSDNNPLMAAAAFANQPQYWKDWAMIFNSPKLKERRGGLKSDIQEAEIAAAAKSAKNKPLAIISYLLKIGFTPTKIADSFAIASGGAAFYRNRVNTYKKQGFEQAEAEAKAFEDFSSISDETQQSGDPMLISKQQASGMGRLILAFQNTPMQMTRIQKRNFQDLINRRPIEGKNQFQSDATYISRILYYGAIQNTIFSVLQQGLFTLLPGFDDEDEEGLSEKEIEKLQRKDEQKVQNVFNSILDTTLRGSGLYGAVASTIKNVIIEYYRQQEKDPFDKDNFKVVLQALNISPPIGSKTRKLYNALNIEDYEKDVIDARGFGVKIDGKFILSPKYQVMGNLAAATTNLPLDRAVSEIDAISEALDSRNTNWQRIALGLGWRSWEVGAEIEEHEEIETIAKAARKEEGIKKRKEEAARKRKIETDALKAMKSSDKANYLKWKKNPENKGKRLLDYLKETNQL